MIFPSVQTVRPFILAASVTIGCCTVLNVTTPVKADIFGSIVKGVKKVGNVVDAIDKLFPRGNPDDGGYEMGLRCEKKAKVGAVAYYGPLSRVEIAAAGYRYRDEALKAKGEECEPHWYWLYARSLAALGDKEAMHIAIHRAATLTSDACISGEATPLGPVIVRSEEEIEEDVKKRGVLTKLRDQFDKEQQQKKKKKSSGFLGLYKSKYVLIAGLSSKYELANVENSRKEMQLVIDKLSSCFPNGALQKQFNTLAPILALQQQMKETDESINEIATNDEAVKAELRKFQDFQATDTESFLGEWGNVAKVVRAKIIHEFREADPYVREAWRTYKAGDKTLAKNIIEQNSPFFAKACHTPEKETEDVQSIEDSYQIEGSYQTALVLACDIVLEGTADKADFKKNYKASKEVITAALINLDSLFGKALTRVRGKHIHSIIKARMYIAQGKYDKAYKNVTKYINKRIEKFEKFQRTVNTSEISGIRMPLLDPTPDQLMLRLVEELTAGDYLPSESRNSLLSRVFVLLQLANPKNETATMIEDLLAVKTGGEIAVIHAEKRELENSIYLLDRELTSDFIFRSNELDSVSLTERSASFVGVKNDLLKLEKNFSKAKKKQGIGLFDNPFDLIQMQQSLDTDEAVMIYFNDKWLSSGKADQMFGVHTDLLSGMLITHKSATFVRLPLFFDDTARLIKRLRRSLSLDGATSLADIEAFDFEASHELYNTLFAPFESDLQGIASLTVIAEGELLSLPFSTLVSEMPEFADFEYDRYAEAAFIAKGLTFRTVPSVRGYMALQETNKKSRSIFTSFLGIGDPELDGKPAPLRSGNLGDMVSSVARFSIDKAVKKLPALPATANELRHISKLMGTSVQQKVLLKKNATEAQLVSLNQSGKLKEYSLVTFATHGLLAGEIGTFDKPALVMTPIGPEIGRDGLLTPREIIDLSFDAQLMVLSACNTAGSNGTPGGQPLSGLATAFFHAGVERLLVSHWPVDSNAALNFNTSFMQNLQQNISVSSALANARIQMMNSKERPEYGHPAFWAAFDLVGAE